MPTFGQIIKARRLQYGWEQTDVAKLVGSTARQVSRWENDQQEPSWSNAVALSNALQLSLGQLAGLSATGLDLSGNWFACWQTTREGLPQINRHEVIATHTGEFMGLRAGGDYSWAAEFRVAGQTMGGHYAALERNEDSLGQMHFQIHPLGDAAIGHWAGRWADGILGDGWGTLARTRSRADRLMGLVKDLDYLTIWPLEDAP